MDNLFTRSCLAFAGSSLAIITISLVMRAQGADYNSNPAWQLIYPISQIFIWTWVLLLLLGMIVGGILIYATLNERHHERALKMDQEQESQKQKIRRRLERKTDLRERELLDAELQLRKQAEDEIRKRDQEERVRLEILRKTARSPEDAIEEALEDF